MAKKSYPCPNCGCETTGAVTEFGRAGLCQECWDEKYGLKKAIMLGPQQPPNDFRIFNRLGNNRPLSDFFEPKEVR